MRERTTLVLANGVLVALLLVSAGLLWSVRAMVDGLVARVNVLIESHQELEAENRDLRVRLDAARRDQMRPPAVPAADLIPKQNLPVN